MAITTSLFSKLPTRTQSRSLIGETANNYEAFFNPNGNFAASFTRTVGGPELKRIAENILFDRAIERIGDGVASLKLTIKPPPDQKKDEKAKEQVDKIKMALAEPNQGSHPLYSLCTKAIIRDILVFGAATVERQPGTDKNFQPFWLWPTDISLIKLNPDWDASREGIDPRFWFIQPGARQEDWIPILNKNMFIIQARSSSYSIIPPSPVRLAYEDMTTWLGLHKFQGRTVNQAVRDYMISLEDVDKEEVDAFREYWRVNVVGQGEIPIIGGKINVVKFGAKTDEELFLKYTEYLTGLIALEFGLSKRDFGLTDHDNRATAGVAADSSFQDAILPMAQTYVQHLDLKVVNFYLPGYHVELADTEPRKESEEAQTATTLYEKGLITKNEGRARVGEEYVIDGDTFKEGGAEKPSDQLPPPTEGEEPPGDEPPPSDNIDTTGATNYGVNQLPANQKKKPIGLQLSKKTKTPDFQYKQLCLF